MARQLDNEEYVAATEKARQVRADVGVELRDLTVATVADQLADLVVESDRMAGSGDVEQRIRLIAGATRAIKQARARQEQARVMGLPIAPSVKDEREAFALLRESCMNCAVALGGWVAQMDYAALQARESDDTVSG